MNQYNIQKHEIKWLASCTKLANTFSTCSKRRYYSVIVAPNKRVIGQGYNGSPPNYPHCIDGACPRAQQGSLGGSAYDNCIANHAEANALLWCDPHHRIGSTLIVNGSPCYGCAKLIASSGILRVVGLSDASYAQQDVVLQFLRDVGIDVCLLDPQDVQRLLYSPPDRLNPPDPPDPPFCF
jgi:dCMP deaminase